MYSAGTHHKRIPKDRRGNLAWRKFVLQKADSSPEYRDLFIQACREDILFYINTFVWQHNPKKLSKEVGPFITWGFQDAVLTSRDPGHPGLLWCIEHGRDAVIEKSRDMGASWLCLIAFEWLWHFHADKNFIVISRNEDAVDKPGTPSCLFWKIDHLHKLLPAWLMPKGWKGRDQKSGHRADLQFVNPENRSVITGEASGQGKAGVGGRATAMFLDEFSQVKEDRETIDRTADTTDCRIVNGTHVGIDTAFFDLTIKPSIKKVVMHWTSHPDKGKGAYHYDPDSAQIVPHDKTFKYPDGFNFVMSGNPAGGPFPGVRSPWYDGEEERRGLGRGLSMDLDIDPKGSSSQFFNASLVKELQRNHCCDPYWQGELVYDRETGRATSLVASPTGTLKMWMNPTPHDGFVAANYAAGADVSWGKGKTPSCFSVVNADTGVKVIEFVNARMVPEDYAAYCVALCRMLKNDMGEGALLGWESQGPGDNFGATVIALGYRRVYYRTDDFMLNPTAGDKPGWSPAASGAKGKLLQDYHLAIIGHQMENRSYDALEETLMFKFDARGGLVHSEEASKSIDPSGARVNHADRVIADALAWKMAVQLGGRPDQKPEEKAAPELSMQWRRDEAERRDKKYRGWI